MNMIQRLCLSTPLLLASPALATDVVLPADGALLHRLHLQLRWESVEDVVSDYRLQIVEDDGSASPFVGGAPVMTHSVSSAEPRTVVETGLEFGKDYAWRVGGAAGSPAVRFQTPVRRFSTATLHPEVSLPQVSIPAGAGVPPEDGIVIWVQRRNMSSNCFILGAEPDGRLVLALPFIDLVHSDMRLMDNGRILSNYRVDETDGINTWICRGIAVRTLDGRRTWIGPQDHCGAPPPPNVKLGPHHEVFPMPADAPHGANFLELSFDNRTLDYVDNVHGGTVYDDLLWQGDQVRELDRHTLEVIQHWSTFDSISLDDHLPEFYPGADVGPGGDWNHCNAAIYDPLYNRVWVSARHQSRVVGIDWATGQGVIQVGDVNVAGFGPWPSGDPDFGDNFFSFQHAPEVLANGNMLVYNNGNFMEPVDLNNISRGRQTQGVEIAFDNPANPTSASIVRTFDLVGLNLSDAAYAPFVGDADRLPGGHTLAPDGPGSSIMEFDAQGNVIWFLDAGPAFVGQPNGVLVYRAEKVPALVIDTPGDADGDWDLDLADLAALQTAYTQPAPLAFPDTLVDHDADGDFDAADVDAFAYWLTGPGR